MTQIMKKAALSTAQQQLMQMMQALNFGRIEELKIRRGEPIFDPSPRVVRQIKFGGDNGPRPELQHSDFALKSQVVELFDHLARIGDGTVETLEVQHGLPFKLTIEHREQ